MRYIGGKSLLLSNIDDVIQANCEPIKTAIDLFSGSCAVARHFKQLGIQITSNDYLYFSYVLQRGSVGINEQPQFKGKGILEAIKLLNTLTIDDTNFDREQCFIANNYSPNSSCERMYFQVKNALKIDVCRLTVEQWYKEKLLDEDGYFYLLACLIEAVPYVANITGTFAAYLKFWDKRTYNSLDIQPLELHNNRVKNECLNLDYLDVLEQHSADLIYADPPYNNREYLPNYHVLETIARYDNPTIHGVTGLREYKKQKSPFCKTAHVHEAFTKLVNNCDCRYLLISYSTDGLLTLDELEEICSYGAQKVSVHKYNYRRYKGKIDVGKKNLKEFLVLVERR